MPLKQLKLLTLRASKTVGAFALASRSRWRRERLLILTYHGISKRDEHLWNPGLFMTPELFRTRMELLKRTGCNVLPLGEALDRLRLGDLPEKSVVLTFDDGFHDFYELAYPVLKEHDFPVTLYLTTFYSSYNRPVFDVVCSYLLWKAGGSRIDGLEFTGQSAPLDLTGAAGRSAAMSKIRCFVDERRLSAEEKDSLAEALARRLGVDYESILSRRILHLLKPEEVTRLSAGGVDIQLHTHRHRTPLDRELFLREIEDNRRAIERLTGSVASHFCYPSGVYHSEFFPWLKDSAVLSATTCDSGLATSGWNQFRLPRFLDGSGIAPIEFEAWLSGLGSLIPERAAVEANGLTVGS